MLDNATKIPSKRDLPISLRLGFLTNPGNMAEGAAQHNFSVMATLV